MDGRYNSSGRRATAKIRIQVAKVSWRKPVAGMTTTVVVNCHMHRMAAKRASGFALQSRRLLGEPVVPWAVVDPPPGLSAHHARCRYCPQEPFYMCVACHWYVCGDHYAFSAGRYRYWCGEVLRSDLEPIAIPSSSRSDRLVRRQWCFRAYCDPIFLAV